MSLLAFLFLCGLLAQLQIIVRGHLQCAGTTSACEVNFSACILALVQYLKMDFN